MEELKWFRKLYISKVNAKYITGLALLSSIGVIAQEKQPNIIMIAVDDLNDWVGVYGGHPQVKTPNIDRLAQKAMVFRNASCPGPVSGPSRSALLSGFMPATTGIYGNSTNMLHSEIVQANATLPEYFSKHGYLTISCGKIFHIHFTPEGDDHGQWAFDEWHQINGNFYDVQKEKAYSCYNGIINGKKIENPLYSSGPANDIYFGPTKGGIETTKDYLTAKWFEQRLHEDFNKPFFMSVGIAQPHLPLIIPEEFFNMYGLDTLNVPYYKMDDLDDIVDKDGKKIYTPHTSYLWARHYGIEKEVVRAYLASISYVDSCVGVILDALAKSKYANNTIVMLFGDNGWHLGEKHRYNKATLWRESTQIPFIINVPGMNKKQECFRNVNLMDIYPTLIDLCNLPKKQLDGKSLKPLLANPELQWTPTITTLNKGNHSVMAEKWHYISTSNGVEELYNIEADPMEFNNLAKINTLELNLVKDSMKTYLPTFNADIIFTGKAWVGRSQTDSVSNVVRAVIRATRDLNKLK